jgi:hypothetical protein
MRWPLNQNLPKSNANLTRLGEFVTRVRILRHVNTDDPQGARGLYRIHQRVHHEIRNFLAVGIVALVTHAFGAAISAEPAGEFSNLIASVAVLGIEGRGANLFGEVEAIFLAIDDSGLGT